MILPYSGYSDEPLNTRNTGIYKSDRGEDLAGGGVRGALFFLQTIEKSGERGFLRTQTQHPRTEPGSVLKSKTRSSVALVTLALVAIFGGSSGDEGKGMARKSGSTASIKATVVVPAYKEAPNSTSCFTIHVPIDSLALSLEHPCPLPSLLLLPFDLLELVNLTKSPPPLCLPAVRPLAERLFR